MVPSRKKIKIEIEDNEGDRYNLCLEGKFSKDKMLKVLELMDTFQEGAIKADKVDEVIHTHIQSQICQQSTKNLGTKLWNVISTTFVHQKFSSTDLSHAYYNIHLENIQLSIVSTYLSRFFIKNKLERTKRGKEWIYSITHNPIRDINSVNSITSHDAVISHDILNRYESIPTVYDLRQ
jgi:hypothetical protein